MDSPTFVTILFASAAAAFLFSGLGVVINVITLVRSRRPSQLGIRLVLAMPGLGMILGSIAMFLLLLSYSEFAAVFPSPVAAVTFALGVLIFVGGLRTQIRVAVPHELARPASGRATWVVAIALVPVFALAMWGVALLPTRPHAGVVAVSSASALALFGAYAFARMSNLPSRLRVFGLGGPALVLALAIVALINTLFLLTLNLPD